MSEPRDVIRLELRRLGNGTAFTDTEDVFERGVIKSLNLIELIAFVEDTFGFEIDQRDVFEGRLRTVDRLVELVDARRGGGT